MEQVFRASGVGVMTAGDYHDYFEKMTGAIRTRSGFDFARKNNIAAFFIVREGDHFTTRFTPAMANYLSENKLSENNVLENNVSKNIFSK